MLVRFVYKEGNSTSLSNCYALITSQESRWFPKKWKKDRCCVNQLYQFQWVTSLGSRYYKLVQLVGNTLVEALRTYNIVSLGFGMLLGSMSAIGPGRIGVGYTYI